MIRDTTNNVSSENQIKTIIVDADDIIKALRFNNREYTNRQTAVIRISPPFDVEIKGEIFYAQAGNYYPPEMSLKPVHNPAKRFITENEAALSPPNPGEVRSRCYDEIDNPGDAEVEAWVQAAFEFWEAEVRNSLADELQEMYDPLPELLTEADIKYKFDGEQ